MAKTMRRRCEPRRTVARRTGVIFMPTVRAPFPNIADHVEKSPGIWFLESHWGGMAATVVFEPGIHGEFRRGIAEMVLRRRSGSAGVLPFRLRWQADGHAATMAERVAELVCFDPTYALNREIRVSVELRRVTRHHGLILPYCHRRVCHPKLVHLNHVLRPFRCKWQPARRSHQITPIRNPPED